MGVTIFCALVAVGHTGASFDRKAQLIEAAGAAAADLRAPTASIARVKAERAARTQAETKIRAALEELGARSGIDDALTAAQVFDERFGSDGSVELQLRISTTDIELRKKPKHGSE